MKDGRPESVQEALRMLPDAQPTPESAVPTFDPLHDLAYLRKDFPFVPILPWPHITRTLQLAANVANDLNIPSEITIGMFLSASTGIYISRDGAAAVPTGALNAQNENTEKSISLITNTFFYLRGMHSVSLICGVNTNVQFMGYATDRFKLDRSQLRWQKDPAAAQNL